jgi:plasmid stability protein
MSKQLTVRGVPDHVAERLERISRAQGRSVNATINEILEQAVGEEARRQRLERYMTWTDQDLAEFDEALAMLRTVDDDLWR